MPVQITIKLRRGTAAEWTAANPTLAAGEMGIETDTNRSKYGDGVTAWTSLSYSVGDSSGVGSIDWTSVTNKPTEFNPEPHAADHGVAGDDPVSIAPSQVVGTAVIDSDSRLTDARTPTAHTHPLSEVSDVTATAAEVNILDGATITTAELNTLDGITATTTELNYTDGVTSNIQTQLNGKYSTSGGTISGKPTVVASSTITSGTGWASTNFELQASNAAGQNPGLALHAPGSSAMSIWHPRGSQSLLVSGSNGAIDSGNNSRSVRNITLSTSAPTGGTDGDVWLVYTA